MISFNPGACREVHECKRTSVGADMVMLVESPRTPRLASLIRYSIVLRQLVLVLVLVLLGDDMGNWQISVQPGLFV